MFKTAKLIFNRCAFWKFFVGLNMNDDFFRNRLNQMIDLRHPLAVLAHRMPWQEMESSLTSNWAREVKAGKKVQGLYLFDPVPRISAGGISNADWLLLQNSDQHWRAA